MIDGLHCYFCGWLSVGGIPRTLYQPATRTPGVDYCERERVPFTSGTGTPEAIAACTARAQVADAHRERLKALIGGEELVTCVPATPFRFIPTAKHTCTSGQVLPLTGSDAPSVWRRLIVSALDSTRAQTSEGDAETPFVINEHNRVFIHFPWIERLGDEAMTLNIRLWQVRDAAGCEVTGLPATHERVRHFEYTAAEAPRVAARAWVMLTEAERTAVLRIMAEAREAAPRGGEAA